MFYIKNSKNIVVISKQKKNSILFIVIDQHSLSAEMINTEK